jgi:hypothetical protein
VAPSLGFDTQAIKQQPAFPIFADLNYEGNLTAKESGGWAFSETHQVTTANSPVKFNALNPWKEVSINAPASVADFTFVRGGDILPPQEPIFYLDGTQINTPGAFQWPFTFPNTGPSAQDIVNNANGEIMNPNGTIDYTGNVVYQYSTFIIDAKNNQYLAYVSFSPLPGYQTLVDSWNKGQGFTVWIYTNNYAPPSWETSVANDLVFAGGVIEYLVEYAGWIALMSGVMVTVLSKGFIPGQLGSAIIILVGVVFVGSILMFIRGNSGSK